MRQGRRVGGATLVAAIAGLCALAGCSASPNADSLGHSTTTSASSSTTTVATSTSTITPIAAVLTAYRAGWAAFEHALADANPEDPATIDTVAVHPDAQHRGVGTALLGEARRRASRAGATMIDAWTRDDEATLAWYRSRGFVESDHYLHVYASYYANPGEPGRAIESTRLELKPVIVFSHAKMHAERDLRRSFARVHVCRRFSQPCSPPDNSRQG